jgi:hypothetical protein
MPQVRRVSLIKLRIVAVNIFEYIAAVALMLVAVALELKALDMLVRLILD